MGNRIRVVRYNLINIVAPLVLISVQVINFIKHFEVFEYLRIFGLIIFWPLVLLSVILSLNYQVMKLTLRLENKVRYSADNLMIDSKKDNGTLTLAMWHALPSTRKKKRETVNKADLIFRGELKDIAVKFEVNEIERVIKYRTWWKAMEFKGDAITFEFAEKVFPASWTVAVNHKTKVRAPQFIQDQEKWIEINNRRVRLRYRKAATKRQLAMVIALLESCAPEINGKYPVMVIFKENKCTIFKADKNGFNFKIPPIISYRKFERIVSKQKITILEFNKMLLSFNRSVLFDSQKEGKGE